MATSEIAQRNRAIKKTLEQAFGRGNIRVRGSRGTGYGYVSVYINYEPNNWERARELTQLCKRLLRAAKVDLGSAYTDDTCQYTTDKCHISFERSKGASL